jgi:hypothetical protein
MIYFFSDFSVDILDEYYGKSYWLITSTQHKLVNSQHSVLL